jgi:hypothetical protein
VSNYEPQENESGEYEIDFKWDAVMAGAAGPRAEQPTVDWYTPQRPTLANPEDAASMAAPPSPVVNPAHYDVLGLVPWEAFDRGWLTKPEFIGHLRGSALEYVARAPHKNGAEDYRKAIRCLEKLLSLLAES